MSSSSFANSHNVLHDATFITAQNYFNGGSQSNANNAFNLLRENIAEDALHNSNGRYDSPRCFPETRTAVQEEILSRINDSHQGGPLGKITWLSSPAGSGKTAIAGTIAEICDERGLLAGSFFFSSFSGSERRKLKRHLIATLAYCFLQHDSLQFLRNAILLAIERDPGLFGKRLKDQCKILLLRPFHALRGQFDRSTLPKVIIIDGLDEVMAETNRLSDEHDDARTLSEGDQLEVLSALVQAAQDPIFPFHILISSRPERAIQDYFSGDACELTKTIFLDEKYHPDCDISLFLKAKFASVRRRYRLPATWPGKEVLESLITKASGQFIYAATVARFLERRDLPPQALLDRVLGMDSNDQGRNPFAQLDALYTDILLSSPDPQLAVRWVGAILGPLRLSRAIFVRQFLSDFDGHASYLLENLVSLLKIPSPEEEHISQYMVYHKSLADFLGSERCTDSLRHAFSDSNSFVWRRASNVLITKSPVVPLTGTSLRNFCHHFLLLQYRMYLTSNAYGPPLPHWKDLDQCDIAWWINTLSDILHRLPKIPRNHFASEVVVYLFHLSHNKKCLTQFPFLGCHDDCRRWRGHIFLACQSRGWRVPTSKDLLVEMRDNIDYEQAQPKFHFRGCFQIPQRLAFVQMPRQSSSEPWEDYETLYQQAQHELQGSVEL